MRQSSIKSGKLLPVLLAAALLTGVSLLSAAPVSAVDTQFNVTVCGDQIPPAVIAVTEPINDSVVSQASPMFRGTVDYSSQIEIYIDDQYVSTVALGSGQKSFETTISLDPGTHTVEVRALAICGGQDAADSVVITYQPATQPSAGETTPTNVDGNVTLDGEPVSAEEINQGSVAQQIEQIEQIPIIGTIYNAAQGFAAAIGLPETFSGTQLPLAAGVARVGLTVTGLTSIVMASVLAPALTQAMPGVSEVFKPKGHRSMIYLGWIIRGVGLVAMFFAYYI